MLATPVQKKKIIAPSSFRERVENEAREAVGLPPLKGGMPIQSEIVVGFAKETTFGTFVAPTTKYVPCVPTFNGNQKNTRPTQARGTRSQVADATTGYELDLSLVGELIPDTWGQLCAGAFGTGSDSVSGTTAFTHALTVKPTCPSFSVEVDYDIVPGEQVLARQAAGCIVDQFQLKATNQSFATVTASLIGQRETTPATPGTPSNSAPTYFTTIEPMDFSLMAATYKGTASTQLLDVTMSIMNHTQRVFASNGQLYAARLVPTLREVQLTTLLDFLNTTYYNDWFSAAKTTGFQFTLTSASNIPAAAVPYSVSFGLPGVRPMGQYSLSAASDVVQENITWSVTLSGSSEITSTWVNDEAGAYA